MRSAWWLVIALCACKFDPLPALTEAGPVDVPPGTPSVGFAAPTSMVAETGASATVEVRLSEPDEAPVTVEFALGTGSARPGSDFMVTAGTLTFAPGEVSQTITVTIADNTALESAETVELVLASPTGAVLGTATHTLTITDDDVCLGAGAYSVCPEAAPTQPVVLPATLDTGSSPLCAAGVPAGWIAAGQPIACFILGTTITIDSTRVTGTRPLVLAATDEIRVMTLLDGASHVADGSRGPGSGVAGPSCVAFGRAPADSTSGAPGGAGATFRSKGGNGGDGNGSNTEGQAGNPVGAPGALQAGCDGQKGGTGDGPAGTEGMGGGALYLVADVITIGGAINASGSGAAATVQTKTGGSGGGSGGMIKLFAASISAAGAIVIANGGGGASGSGGGNGGTPGSDPSLALPLAAAPGGPDNGTSGTAGGAGSLGTNNGGNGANSPDNNEGGGGGGGGAGQIETNISLMGANVSPPPVVL